MQGCAALRNVSLDVGEGARGVIDAEGVEALATAMRRFPCVAQLQQLACSALACLAAVDEAAKRLVVQSRGCHLATAAMLRHVLVPSVQEKGCALLCNLAAGTGGLKEAIIREQARGMHVHARTHSRTHACPQGGDHPRAHVASP